MKKLICSNLRRNGEGNKEENNINIKIKKLKKKMVHMLKDRKPEQIRNTLEDTLYYQNDLMKFVEEQIQKNKHLDDDERCFFRELLIKSLVTVGADFVFSFNIHDTLFVFESYQAFAMRIASLKYDKLILKTKHPEEKEIVVDIKELWKVFYKRLFYYLQKSATTAFIISGENVRKTEQQNYYYSSKQKLKQ